ncbi:Polyketide cyclase / dehydrase and lipid transport [Tenacibaculum sp. 190524A02b]|uniref:SRPBCC domain-containing protein n=1 Tax=Tenacibaculum vairaonense TaxID=3137860 RepID=UPI0032B28D6C
MKTVKIILGIVIALSLAFFATGIIISELNYEAEVIIEKPVEEVFTIFNDDESIKHWIPEIKSIKAVKELDGKVGSTYEIKVENQGEEITLNEKIKEFEVNKKITLFFNGGGMLKRDAYSFESKGGQTVLKLQAKFKSSSFILGCMLPFVKGKLQEQDQKYLMNFKKFAEK